MSGRLHRLGDELRTVAETAGQAWERAKSGRPLETGDQWETISHGYRKVGFLHRTISTPDDDATLVTQVVAVELAGPPAWATTSMRIEPGGDWSAYVLTRPGRTPVTWRWDGAALRGAGAEVPWQAPPVPSLGFYPIVTTLPLEAGHVREVTVLADDAATAEGSGAFVAHGWESVGEEEEQLWRVDHFVEGRRSATFWLDVAHRIRLADWVGAICRMVTDADEALAGLSDQMRDLAKRVQA